MKPGLDTEADLMRKRADEDDMEYFVNMEKFGWFIDNNSKNSSIANCHEVLRLCQKNNWKNITIVNVPDKFYLHRFAYTLQFIAQEMGMNNLTIFILPANTLLGADWEFKFSFKRHFTSDTDLWWLNTRKRFFWWNVISSIATWIFLKTGYWKKMVNFKQNWKRNIKGRGHRPPTFFSLNMIVYDLWIY